MLFYLQFGMDFESIKKISDGDKEIENSLFESFLLEFPLLIQELKVALNKKDVEEIFKICHKIKSPLSLFGMKILLKDINSLEDLIKKFDVEFQKNIKKLLEISDNIINENIRNGK